MILPSDNQVIFPRKYYLMLGCVRGNFAQKPLRNNLPKVMDAHDILPMGRMLNIGLWFSHMILH